MPRMTVDLVPGETPFPVSSICPHTVHTKQVLTLLLEGTNPTIRTSASQPHGNLITSKGPTSKYLTMGANVSTFDFWRLKNLQSIRVSLIILFFFFFNLQRSDFVFKDTPTLSGTAHFPLCKLNYQAAPLPASLTHGSRPTLVRF